MIAASTVRRVALATWFPREPGSPRGGVEAVSVNLSQALSQCEELEVHVVTLDSGVSKAETTEWNGIVIHRLPRGGGSLLRFASGSGRKLVQDYLLRLRPDIVHAHDTFGIMTKGLALPRAFTIHGFIHEDTRFQSGLTAFVRSWLWKREEVAAWADQPHVISISPYVRERLQGMATGVIHDIENPIAPECFDSVRDEQSGTIFSAAVICERKNTLGLIEAFALAARQHPEARLRLAGPVTDPGYGEAVKRCIEESGLSDRIILLGSVSGIEVRREISRASAFALLSLEEGAPLGIAEAMAAGVPILTSNRCGMPYMVRHGESGFLVDPANVQDIARHLSELLEDTSLRQRMGAQARQAAFDLYHPRKVAARTIRVYEGAVRPRQAN